MVFTDYERNITTALCTLKYLTADMVHFEPSLVHLGQLMGVSRDEVFQIIEDWEDHDIWNLNSQHQKQEFINTCFGILALHHWNDHELRAFYAFVIKKLKMQDVVRPFYERSMN